MLKTYEFRVSEEKIIPINIKKKWGVRNISLRQNPGIRGFNLTIPWLLSEKRAIEFINQNHKWIIKHSLSHQAKQKFIPGESINFLGEPHIIRNSGESRGVTRIENGEIIVSGSSTNIGNKLLPFLKKELAEHAMKLIKIHTSSMDLKFTKLDIRNTNSRWGSCSSTGRIMLSLRLIMCPYDIIEYVIVHELCHLFEMNHSKRFWSLVEKYYPAHKQARQWLKKEGHKLPIL